MELNKIYLGDCLEVMKEISDKSVDMILCDLPYGVLKSADLNWDNIIPFDELWVQYDRIIKPNGAILLFSQGVFNVDLINSNRKDFKYNLIWKKNVPTGMSSAKYRPMKYYEMISVFYKLPPTYNPIMKSRVGVGKDCYNYDHYCGNNRHIKFGKIKKRYNPDLVQPSDVLEFDVVPNRRGKLHPTQKPVSLLEYLITTYTNSGDVVLDNCIGSGTTAIACINTNRNYIGIEKDETYFNVANERVAKHVG